MKIWQTVLTETSTVPLIALSVVFRDGVTTTAKTLPFRLQDALVQWHRCTKLHSHGWQLTNSMEREARDTCVARRNCVYLCGLLVAGAGGGRVFGCVTRCCVWPGRSQTKARPGRYSPIIRSYRAGGWRRGRLAARQPTPGVDQSAAVGFSPSSRWQLSPQSLCGCAPTPSEPAH